MRTEKLREKLRGRRGDFPLIASETGLNVEWLRKFSQGRIEDPGSLRLDTLESYLHSAVAE